MEAKHIQVFNYKKYLYFLQLQKGKRIFISTPASPHTDFQW